MAVSFSEAEVLELLRAMVDYSAARAKKRRAAIDLCTSEVAYQREMERERSALDSARGRLDQSDQRLVQAAGAGWTTDNQREEFLQQVRDLADGLV